MASTASESTNVEDSTTNNAQTHHKETPSTSHGSDPEKELLSTYEVHDADIHSNEGDILAEGDEFKGETFNGTTNSHPASPINIDAEKTRPETMTQDVEKQGDIVSAEEDNNIVFWDGPDDPQNPLNFSRAKKVLIITLVSAICFVTPLGSSMFAPGVPDLMRDFKSDNVLLASFVVSVYVLGFAVGPLFFAPMSEIYGRMPIYHFCNVGFLLMNMACALATNLNMLIGFRFLAGVFGSAPLTNGGGSIADLIIPEKRGKAMSGFVLGPMIGPVIGPVAGGYLAQSKGWRWTFWLLCMLGGLFAILSLLFMRETYAPAILERKAKRLRKETGNQELRSKLDSGLTPKDLFLHSVIRPTKLLILSPIVLLTSIFVGVVYGYLYLLFTTFTLVFEQQYHFAPGSVGLTYLGLGIGSLVGIAYFAWSTDRTFKKRREAAEAQTANATAEEGDAAMADAMKPEIRMQMVISAYALIPVGLFLYGWTAEYKVHWIVPIIATVPIGIGNLAVFMSISLYLIDAYSIYAASALAANTVIRSIMGAVLPLAGQKMYDKLGLGWGNSLLGFVAVALLPIPWLIYTKGEWLRKKFAIENL